MAQKKQAALYLQQLKQQYPAAFKHNDLFYSQLKTQGILDELKELIPWVLAAMNFYFFEHEYWSCSATVFSRYE